MQELYDDCIRMAQVSVQEGHNNDAAMLVRRCLDAEAVAEDNRKALSEVIAHWHNDSANQAGCYAIDLSLSYQNVMGTLRLLGYVPSVSILQGWSNAKWLVSLCHTKTYT